MSARNPFGAAFEQSNRQTWPQLGLRRPYNPPPSMVAAVAEVIAAGVIALSAAIAAVGVFTPEEAGNFFTTEFRVEPNWLIGSGGVGLLIGVFTAAWAAVFGRSRSAWWVVATGLVLMAAGAVAAMFR